MLFHVYDVELGFFASITEHVGKYFSLKTLYNNEFVSWSKCHIYFAKGLLLNIDKSLNPIPP